MRYPYFDNAKAMLIFLVVFGHFIVQRGEVGEGLYWLIYSFHMPAFIFIAGYFTKKETWKATFTSVIGQFLLPYLIFQSVYNLYNYYLFDINMNALFGYANFALWFLLAMVYWKVTLQIIIRWKWTIIPFIILYLSHRFFIEDLKYLAVGRAITFSLFFYLGHFAKHWTPTLIKTLQTIPLRTLLFPVIGFIGVVLVSTLHQAGLIVLERKWFYGTFNAFDTLLEKQTAFELLVYQLGTTLLSLVMVVLFLLLVPTKNYVWTRVGSATLSIYLFHGFVRNYLVHKDYLFQANTWTQVFALATLSFVVVYVFSQKPFKEFVNFTTSFVKSKKE